MFGFGLVLKTVDVLESQRFEQSCLMQQAVFRKEAGEQAFEPEATVDRRGKTEGVTQMNREEQVGREETEDERGQVGKDGG